MVAGSPITLLQRETAVRYGTVPDGLGATPVGLEQYALVGDEFLMRTKDGLAFHYRKGHGVTVELGAQADPADEGLYLNGSVYAAAASINGFYPLHASAIAVDGQVIAFTGPAGAGKSTLIAELGRRGYPMVCDDTLILSTPAAGPIQALPGHKRLKLTSSAFELTGAAQQERVAQTIEKHYATPAAGTITRILPLTALFLLVEGPQAAVEPVRGGACLRALQDDHYTQGLFLAANRPDRAERFAQLARLAGAIGIYRFIRPHDARAFSADVDLLEEHLHAFERAEAVRAKTRETSL
jgi:hypothetical protein